MARKRTVRRSRGRRINSRVSRRNRTPNGGNKIALDIRSLLLFIAMSLVSLVLYKFLPNTLLTNLFYIMAIVFGFVAVGLLIALLVLEIMRIVRK
jgi:hypothetical protein